MAILFTPKQAQEMLDISATGLRIYSTTYPKHLSTEATGKRKKFTDSDLCFLSYIKERTDAGDNHRELLKELDTDEGKARFAAYEATWEPLAPPDEGEEGGEPGTAMVPVAQLQAARLLFEDAQRREQEAKEEAAALQQAAQERERQLQDHIGKLERELGKAEATQILYEDARRREDEALRRSQEIEQELTKLRASKPKGFWARLFGGGES